MDTVKLCEDGYMNKCKHKKPLTTETFQSNFWPCSFLRVIANNQMWIQVM